MVERAFMALAALAALGCGGAETKEEQPKPDEPEPPPMGCSLGERTAEDGSCIPPGLPPDMPCPVGQGMDGGACVAAGVPPSGCGVGFTHDGAGACAATLPASPCAAGAIALPGDTACREIADCGTTTWGSIAVAADTQYVDQNNVSGMSDGSVDAPWLTIQHGVDAAAAGAVVAVAAGSYVEDVLIENKPLQLRGRCPERVEVVGVGGPLATVSVGEGATGTVVSGFAITGDGYGVLLSGSLDVVLDTLWVHDNVGVGVDIEGSFGPTGVTLRDSLIEDVDDFGVFVVGAEVTVERVAIRGVDAGPAAQGAGAGVGLSSYGGAPYPPTDVTVRGSLIERAPASVFVMGETVTVEDSLLRDTAGSGRTGGIFSQVPCFNCIDTTPHVTVRRSVIQDVHPAGIVSLGGTVDVEHVVVRDVVRAPGAGDSGQGIVLAQLCGMNGGQAVCNGDLRSSGTIRASMLASIAGRGMHVWGSDAIIDRVAVLDSPTPDTTASTPGVGIDSLCFQEGPGVRCDAAPSSRANATITSSHIERSQGVALLVGGSDATIDGTLVRNTFANADAFGRAFQVQEQCGAYECSEPIAGSAVITASQIESSVDFGVAVMGSTATIDSSLIMNTAPGQDGFYGDGVVVFSTLAPASANVLSTRVDQSGRAGLASFGAHASLGNNVFVCQAFDLNGEEYQGVVNAFDNLGNNGCGCPDPTKKCAAKSANLAPPPALEPAPP